MKITKKFAAFATLLIFALVTAAVAFAAQDGVDWSRGVIRATGLAAGKKDETSPGLYRAQAKRAATMDAMRNLAEAVDGVRVTSSSSMKDLRLQYDEVNTRLDTTIKGMREVDIQYFEDGTCQVVFEMSIFGASGSVSDAAFLPFKNEPKVDFPQPVDKKIANDPNVVGKNYTGLVIDCRGLGTINYVMSPVIKNADGTKIYGHQNLDIDKIIINGMAAYASDAYDQISAQRAGNNPLVIKAVRLDDLNSNPVVSVADADRILAANGKDKFLDNCAVVFVK
ncbi:MAG: hypothetical protein IJ685_07785 [Selenomonadaceae bacterium]|nr:hypothetical protein [Selenomonadaceae bacterium]